MNRERRTACRSFAALITDTCKSLSRCLSRMNFRQKVRAAVFHSPARLKGFPLLKPPFNRIRFGAMFISVFLVSVICRSQIDPNVPNSFVAAVGMLMGHVMDFPYSPVHLFLLMLPDDTPGQTVNITRSAAGLAYVVSIASIAAFSIVLRLYNWPLRNGNFNVWVNLPTFDPTTGGDVVERLQRAARVNLLLGFLLPFLFPAGVTLLTSMVDTLTFENSHTLIWTVTAWALLPASLFMRGIAVQRIAHLICEQRRQTEAFIADTGLQPV